ncbi:MAG: hypothetical protein JNL57_11275 [Bacteroidetes bacterium]|nr:hypothetical protein [Bacteroidota bacterium]
MKPIGYISLCAALALSGCIKDTLDKARKIKKVKWTGTYAAPLIIADLDLADAVDLVKDAASLGIQSDQTVYLEYANAHVSVRATDWVKLQNQNGSQTEQLSPSEQTALLTSGAVQVMRNFSHSWSNGGMELDSFLCSAGSMQCNFNTNLQHDGSITLVFNSLIKNGAPLTLTGNFTYTGGLSSLNFNRDLTGYVFDLSRSAPGYNQFEASVRLDLTKSGSVVLPSDQFQINVSLNGMQYRRVHGYFGQTLLLNPADSAKLSVFTSALSKGKVQFEDPRVKLAFTNSMGLPYRFTANSIHFSIPGVSFQNLNAPPAPFPGKAAAFSALPSVVKDSIVYNNGNSNVKALIANEPHYFAYDVSALANPLGKTSNRNFLWDESVLELKASLELPFYGISSTLVLEDTSDFSLNGGKEVSYIDWIRFRFHTENGMPLSLGFQAYFMDSFNHVLDSVFTPYRYILPGATVDAGGNVTAPAIEQFDAIINRPRIAHINEARKLRLRIMVPTSQYNGSPGPVRITRNQKIKLKAGVEIKLSANAPI